MGSGRAFQIGGMQTEKKCFLRSRRAGLVSSESGSDDRRVWGPSCRVNKVSQVELSTFVKPRSILNVSMQSPLVRRSFRDVKPVFNNFSLFVPDRLVIWRNGCFRTFSRVSTS